MQLPHARESASGCLQHRAPLLTHHQSVVFWTAVDVRRRDEERAELLLAPAFASSAQSRGSPVRSQRARGETDEQNGALRPHHPDPLCDRCVCGQDADVLHIGEVELLRDRSAKRDCRTSSFLSAGRSPLVGVDEARHGYLVEERRHRQAFR
jgi:hypothetical protein